jgi:hypothetical protein
LRGRSGKKNPDYWVADKWTVEEALVPKHLKMRLSIEELFSDLVYLRPAILKALPNVPLDYDVRLSSGVGYKRSTWDHGFARDMLGDFLKALSLSRHVGVISVLTEASFLADFLVDTTEVNRGRPSVLGIVAPGIPFRSPADAQFAALARYWRCSYIRGDQTS